MLHVLRYEPDAGEALHRLLTTPRFATLAERVEMALQAIASDPGSAKGRSGQLRLPIRGHTVWRTRVSGSGEVRVVLWTLPEDQRNRPDCEVHEARSHRQYGGCGIPVSYQ